MQLCRSWHLGIFLTFRDYESGASRTSVLAATSTLAWLHTGAHIIAATVSALAGKWHTANARSSLVLLPDRFVREASALFVFCLIASLTSSSDSTGNENLVSTRRALTFFLGRKNAPEPAHVLWSFSLFCFQEIKNYNELCWFGALRCSSLCSGKTVLTVAIFFVRSQYIHSIVEIPLIFLPGQLPYLPPSSIVYKRSID